MLSCRRIIKKIEVQPTDRLKVMYDLMKGLEQKEMGPCGGFTLIKKIEVQPTDRLKVMYDLMKGLEQKEMGPCGGFTLMYSCMCDYHGLTYRDEVAWVSSPRNGYT